MLCLFSVCVSVCLCVSLSFVYDAINVKIVQSDRGGVGRNDQYGERCSVFEVQYSIFQLFQLFQFSIFCFQYSNFLRAHLPRTKSHVHVQAHTGPFKSEPNRSRSPARPHSTASPHRRRSSPRSQTACAPPRYRRPCPYRRPARTRPRSCAGATTRPPRPTRGTGPVSRGGTARRGCSARTRAAGTATESVSVSGRKTAARKVRDVRASESVLVRRRGRRMIARRRAQRTRTARRLGRPGWGRR